tara:strand:+ start:1562 stop:2431 length:870 start_codon:yes stop_codon:yes gene_type:complete
MSENNCDAAIQRNNRIQEQVFRQTLEKGLQGTSIGKFQRIGENIQQQNNRTFAGTSNRNGYFNQSLWDFWKNFWYFQTRESFDNIKTMNYLDQAINARHKALRGITSPSFDTDCNNNVAKVMLKFKEKELSDFDKLNSYMSSLLTSYKHLFDYKSTVKAAYNEKMNKLANITDKIDSYKQNLFMDERKNKYQSDSYDFYKSAHFFVLIIYFSLLALYLIFSDFIKEQRYKERKNIIGLISFIITPFLLGYVLDNIYKIYIFVLEYNNIRDDVISYPYIVNKFNKIDHEM